MTSETTSSDDRATTRIVVDTSVLIADPHCFDTFGDGGAHHPADRRRGARLPEDTTRRRRTSRPHRTPGDRGLPRPARRFARRAGSGRGRHAADRDQRHPEAPARSNTVSTSPCPTIASSVRRSARPARAPPHAVQRRGLAHQSGASRCRRGRPRAHQGPPRRAAGRVGRDRRRATRSSTASTRRVASTSVRSTTRSPCTRTSSPYSVPVRSPH